MKQLINLLCLLAGIICMVLGAIGIVLPVLPTTPFLLLAATLFAKSSKRFHRWFVGTQLYQNHLESFVRTRSMTLKTKLCILIPASSMMALAFYFSPIWHAKAFIIVAVIFKYYYFFFRIRTIKDTESVTE